MNTQSNIRHSTVEALMQDHNDQCISLRRVTPLENWPTIKDPVEPVMRLAVLDTESTGLDPSRDKVIEIALAIVDVDAIGRVVRVARTMQALQDPRVVLPLHIEQLTGLTDEMLQGQSIDKDSFAEALNSASAIICHHASHDRPFVERLLPELKEKPWACSVRDCSWSSWGFDGAKADHLLMQSGMFNPQKHRAMDDVTSLVNLLNICVVTGGTPFGEAILHAQNPSWRFSAPGLPYDLRHAVKDRGWRWNSRQKLWWTEVSDDEREFEEAAFARATKSWGRRPKIEEVTWTKRYKS